MMSLCLLPWLARETPVPLKARYMKKDLQDWARSAGLAIKMPPTEPAMPPIPVMEATTFFGNMSETVV